MFKLVIRYYGELCDKEKVAEKEVYDEEILGVAKYRIDLLQKMEKKIIEFIQNNYIIDNEEAHKDLTRLFFENVENWNNYVELEIIEIKKEDNVMGYAEELEKLAKESFEKFMNYIDEHTNLLTETDEDENGNTMVIVTNWEDDGNNENYIGTYIFDEDGNFLSME